MPDKLKIFRSCLNYIFHLLGDAFKYFVLFIKTCVYVVTDACDDICVDVGGDVLSDVCDDVCGV